MAKIIQFPFDSSPRRNLKKANKSRKKTKDPDQLDLFTDNKEGKLVGMNLKGRDFENGMRLMETDVERAIYYFKRSLEDEENSADAHCNLGVIYHRESKDVLAIDHFTQALKFETRHFEAHYNLANTYFELGNYKLAEVHYQVAKEVEPEDANVRYNLSLVYANQNKVDDAINELNGYISLGNSLDDEANKLMVVLKGSQGGQING